MAKDLSGLEAAGSALYDAGFADGVASVGVGPDPTPFSQADLDNQKAALKASFKAILAAEDADGQTKVDAL